MRDFIKEFYPEIEESYQRYLRKNTPPKVGSTVKSLRSGFGGSGGQTLKVIDVDDNGITLQLTGLKYFSRMENWWKELSIVSENEI